MTIAQSKTREQFPLSYKKIIKKTIVSVISFALLILFISFAIIPILTSNYENNLYQVISIVGLISLGVLLITLIMAYFYQRWYFEVYFYDLSVDYVQIKKGPITPREITIPYERIQDVYVDQDLLDRMFGLYDVHLSSATSTSGMEAHIDGVEKEAAEGLRRILLDSIKQKISTDRTNP